MLEGISGGYLFVNQMDEWEVINDRSGNVMATFATRDEANSYAKSHGMSTEELHWEDLADLRGLEL